MKREWEREKSKKKERERKEDNRVLLSTLFVSQYIFFSWAQLSHCGRAASDNNKVSVVEKNKKVDEMKIDH